MMPNNAGIKAFVEKQLRSGVPREKAWHLAREKFPHRIVSWSYVISIDNRLRWGDDRSKVVPFKQTPGA